MKAHEIANKEELIKAVRYCGKGVGCHECPIYYKPATACFQIMTDAADALEADEKRIEELEKSYAWKAYSALEERIEGYKVRIAELEAQNKLKDGTITVMATDIGKLQAAVDNYEKLIAELSAQIPKKGEWMKNIRWYYQRPTQSATANVGTTFMCRSTGKLCQNATEYGYCKHTASTIVPAR